MSQTFITKYRPYTINEFCSTIPNTDKDYCIKSILKTLLDIDEMNILIVGDASSGKTTLLNAIIREYYGFNKDQNIPETNIMFINSLKEQGIQFYRNDMRTFCQTRSTIYGKKKMVVIDDIDMINEQSQQVFRNYIDKYKHNVHFITTCNNIQKVIESIQSRIHIVRIHSQSKEQIRLLMEKIILSENIQISQEAQEYLMTFCTNSTRSLINTLEKMYILNENITIEKCCILFSDISFKQFETYIEHLKSGDLILAIGILYNIHDYGYSVIDILDYFFTFVKATEILTEEQKYKTIKLICVHITIFYNMHEDSIALAIMTNNMLSILK
jgi:DNA polymerase III delta prime subunit